MIARREWAPSSGETEPHDDPADEPRSLVGVHEIQGECGDDNERNTMATRNPHRRSVPLWDSRIQA